MFLQEIVCLQSHSDDNPCKLSRLSLDATPESKERLSKLTQFYGTPIICEMYFSRFSQV